MKIHTFRQLTIAPGGTTSGEFEMDNFSLVGIFVPATFIGTAITFQIAPNATGGGVAPTFYLMKDGAGNNYSKTTTTVTAQYIPIPPLDFAGVRCLKLVSNATETTGATFNMATRQIA